MTLVVTYPDVGGMYGIKRYGVELIRALQTMGMDVRAHASWAREWKVGPYKVGGLVTRRLANYVPIVGADLVHATSYTVNPKLPGADVVTVHDIMPFAHPEFWNLTPRERATHEADIRRAVETADVITDSRHTRDEMARVLGVDVSRVSPVHLAISHETFYPDPYTTEERAADPLARLLRPGMLNVLVVMNTEPRKRVDLVLEAARKLPYVHVIRVGNPRPTHGMEGILDLIRPHAEALARERRLAHLAYASDTDLRRLYSSADVVVHPSVDEGFGLPPLEALACGARVVASDIPCHREVLEDAVRYAPLTAEGVERSLTEAWDGSGVRDSAFPPLERRVRHARKFTWERTARETLRVYERARPGFAAPFLSPREPEIVSW